MLKILIIFILLTQVCWAKIQISITSSEAANSFEILDNLSQWYPGFNTSVYNDYWKQHKLTNSEDAKFFKQYKALREKYFHDPDQSQKDPLKNRNGFFSTLGSKQGDPLAYAFYRSSSLESGLKEASQFISREEADFLKSFYLHFQKRLKPLIAETTAFKPMMEELANSFQKPPTQEYLGKLQKFYGISQDLEYLVVFVWWPPIADTRGDPAGDFLILKQHPIKHQKTFNADIVMHEVAHSLSSRMPFERKQLLTKTFLEICPVQTQLKKLLILEEPLAVAAGQILFTQQVYPDSYKFAVKWYNNSWNSLFGKLISPVVKQYLDHGKKLDQKLIKDCAFLCKELTQTFQQLGKK